MLNETFPASMAFVSTSNSSDSERRVATWEFVKSFSEEVLTGGNRPFYMPGDKRVQIRIRKPRYPKIFLSGSRDECSALQAHLEEKGIVSEQIVVCSEKEKWTWQQDFMQGYFNPSSGHPVVKINRDYYPESTSYKGNTRTFYRGNIQFKALGPVISKTCPGVEVHGIKLGKSGGSMGGNFEGIPPHFCVVGKGDLGRKEFKKVSGKVCGDADLIKAPTSFLAVGHTDEIMKTVPSGKPPPCDFKVLIADQSLGMELLDKNKGLLFDIGDPVMSDYLKRISIAGKICAEALRFRQKPDDQDDDTRSVSFLNSFMRKIFSVNEAHGRMRVINSQSSSNNRLLTKAPDKTSPPLPHPCEGVTGSDFISGLLEYRDNRDFSRIVDKKLDMFAAEVESRIKDKSPECSSPVMRVPTLYYAPWSLHDVEPEEKKIEGAEAEAVFPNLTNGLVIGSKIVFPNQVVTPYNNFLKKIAKETSMSHSTINTNFLHEKMGNLHCASNLVRYCRPRRN